MTPDKGGRKYAMNNKRDKDVYLQAMLYSVGFKWLQMILLINIWNLEFNGIFNVSLMASKQIVCRPVVQTKMHMIIWVEDIWVF